MHTTSASKAVMEIREITAIEDRYCGQGGDPTLGEAYAAWQQRWAAGERDRETALRLLFLSWYACSEPTEFTGLPEDRDGSVAVFQRSFDHLRQLGPGDAEFLFVAGYMARVFPWCCGGEPAWTAMGRECLDAYGRSGSLIGRDVFRDRGAYGEYFAHIVDVGWMAKFGGGE
jgi:hypothetical protein